MKSHDLKRTIERQGVAPIYLVLGEEDDLRDHALRVVKEAVLGGGDGDAFNCDLFYGDECTASDVVQCAQEIPVFSERRLVILKNVEKLAAREFEHLVEYVQAPNSSTSLVLSASKLDGRLKATQALKSKAQVVDCASLPTQQVTPWIREQAADLHVKLDEDAVQALAELADRSLGYLRRELEKVAVATPADTVAGAADVDALRGVEPGASVFDLSAAITSGDHARALRIVSRNLDAGEAPLRILGALLWQFRRLWKAHALLAEGRADADVGRSAGIPPFRLREFLGQVRQMTDLGLQQTVQLFLEADNAIKGGSAASPRRTLEWLVFRLCGGLQGQTQHGAVPAARAAGMARTPPPRKTKSIQTVRTIRSGIRRSN